MNGTTAAFVGATGGAGTTRLTLECGRLLASTGHDTAVFDAAYATQGLADHVSGRIDTDVTALCLGDERLEAALYDQQLQGAGRLAVCPARAPFERFARAKRPEAAEAFEEQVTAAARQFDYVLVDTPPVAGNQAVAAVNAAEAVAVVCDADRAADAVPRMGDRLADVGAEPDATVVTHATAHEEGDVAVPPFEADKPGSDEDAPGYPALVDVVNTVTEASVPKPEAEGVLDRLVP